MGMEIGTALLEWYDANKRSLPWREDPSPYHVWISEIMLQQTRVEAVRGYYRRFLEKFPDIPALARAQEDECLKLWEGLGYYSRARNLQKAARIIVSDYQARMPETARDLQKLPGIGPYTAAAIASICFGERVPAIDGNLLRVFARLSLYEEEIGTPAARKAADAFYRQVMPQDRPGDFNQALMDLGSGICTPGGEPACRRKPSPQTVPAAPACPLQPFCRAFQEDKCGVLPVMPRKKARQVRKRTILVIRDQDRVLLRKRPSRGLLAGLYEFPNEEGWLTEQEAVARARSYGCEPLRIRPLPASRHIFTHREWLMQGYEIRTAAYPEAGEGTEEEAGGEGGCFAAPIPALRDKYAIPGAYAAYLKIFSGEF